VSKNYAVRLRCPYGDNESWIILENRDETLEQILRTSWDFECEAHGVQREFPMEASAKDTELASKPQAAKPAGRIPRRGFHDGREFQRHSGNSGRKGESR